MTDNDDNGEKDDNELNEKLQQEKPFVKFDAEYMGGHPMYPKKQKVKALLFNDLLRLERGGNDNINIPYLSIKKIENATAKHIEKERVFLVGIIGLFWKKEHLYTVIDYVDGTTGEDVSIVIDFRENVEDAQQLIYLSMLDAKEEAKARKDDKIT